jgi:cation diffusion facilitator family transporter
MSCGCEAPSGQSPAERRVLTIALTLNATMFVVGLVAGLVAQSTGLLADALDMLSDAGAYGIAIIALHRGAAFKAGAARFIGVVIGTLGLAVLADAARRAFGGSEPTSWIMLATATCSLVVNVTVLRLLAPYRRGEVHLRASYICTRADVVANVGVIAAGLIVMMLGWRWIDLVVGAAIGLYVLKEALEILREAGEATDQARAARTP